MTNWPDLSDPGGLEFHFQRCWPWLEASLAKQPIPTHDKAHVWEALSSGRALLWATATSGTVTEETTYPNGNRVLFAWLAGGELSALQTTAKHLERYAKNIGCVAFAMVVMRDGFARAFPEYEKAGVTLMKDLR